MTTPLCGFSGKPIHATKEAAGGTLARVGFAQGSKRVYWCWACQGWHVTSKRKKRGSR